MSLILVKDTNNSKLRELECDASGNLKVEKVDVSALSTESTMSAMNTKITSCDTGNISGVVAVSAVAGNVACTHASLPLPTGAATEASLATISGCVTASKLAVESSASVLTVTDAYLWGDATGSESVLNELDSFSDSVDVSTYNKISIYGSSSNLSDEFEIQVSHDDTNWFELTEKYVSVDYSSGHFGLTIDPAFSYIRMKKVGTGSAMMSDDLWAICSGKK
mgnify:FL=1